MVRLKKLKFKHYYSEHVFYINPDKVKHIICYNKYIDIVVNKRKRIRRYTLEINDIFISNVCYLISNNTVLVHYNHECIYNLEDLLNKQ